MSETTFHTESDTEGETRGKDPHGIATVMGGDRGQTTLDFAIGISVFLLTVAFVLAFIPGMVQPFTGGVEEETVAVNRVADSLSQGMLGDPAEPNVLDRECTIIFFENNPTNDPGNDDDENRDGDGVYSDPFGDDSDTYSGSCNFEDRPLPQRLGIEARESSGLNVRIRLIRDIDDGGNKALDPGTGVLGSIDSTATTLCLDTNNPRIVEGGDPTDDDDDGDGNSDSWEVQCDITGGDDDVYFETGGTPPEDTGSVVVARRVVSIEGGFADGTNDATLVVEMW